jgi:hypothetical protein
MAPRARHKLGATHGTVHIQYGWLAASAERLRAHACVVVFGAHVQQCMIVPFARSRKLENSVEVVNFVLFL